MKARFSPAMDRSAGGGVTCGVGGEVVLLCARLRWGGNGRTGGGLKVSRTGDGIFSVCNTGQRWARPVDIQVLCAAKGLLAQRRFPLAIYGLPATDCGHAVMKVAGLDAIRVPGFVTTRARAIEAVSVSQYT